MHVRHPMKFVPFPTTLEAFKAIIAPDLPLPKYCSARAHAPLSYIFRYLARIRCVSVVIEEHYIDRDYIDDHSYFYSKNLSDPVNYCSRAFFFSSTAADTRRAVRELTENAHLGTEKFVSLCREFSDRAFLGFCTIKPLPGAPVGRTVLRHLPEMSDSGEYVREFGGCREYKVHVSGIPLFIPGLAFQQQDIGVSACATVAIWSALQKTTDGEHISRATPAVITRNATQYNLPFGRATPAEGLSTDQMCHAIRQCGKTPYLVRLDGYRRSIAYIYATIRSGHAAIIIMRNSETTKFHAAPITGVKLDYSRNGHVGHHRYERAWHYLSALYLHDDRLGPYVRADYLSVSAKSILGFSRTSKSDDYQQKLTIACEEDGVPAEEWEPTHLLVPVHGKIRLLFADLLAIHEHLEQDVANAIAAYILPLVSSDVKLDMYSDSWIERSVQWAQHLYGDAEWDTSIAARFIASTPLSRYVGIIRFATNVVGDFDVVVDTTCTRNSVRFLGVVPASNAELARTFCAWLERFLNVPTSAQDRSPSPTEEDVE